jgi:hypothetical protein
MRFQGSLAVALLLGFSALPVLAAGIDDKPVDLASIQALETRANQAQPREQCFLYAELVHQMTEVSVRQYASGDVDKATSLLKRIQDLTHKIHLSMASNNKRAKDAEILLNHTAFRLNGMLHASSFEDRPLVQETLSDVSQAENEAMLQVFHNK